MWWKGRFSYRAAGNDGVGQGRLLTRVGIVNLLKLVFSQQDLCVLLLFSLPPLQIVVVVCIRDGKLSE